MPKQQPQLFRSRRSAKKRRGTRAPDNLTPPQLKQLEEWAEVHCPWLRREALESFERVETYVEEALDYWRGDGGVKADWVATCRNRIRTAERRRLGRMAAKGSAEAAVALRDPVAWAERYDQLQKAAKLAAQQPEEDATPFDLQGGKVLSLDARRRRGR
jgi:hypothetical protein